jgi:hypothetical protein
MCTEMLPCRWIFRLIIRDTTVKWESQGSVVGLAVGLGTEVPGLEQQTFLSSRASRTTLEPTLLPIQWALAFFPGREEARAWSWPLTSFYSRVTEWVTRIPVFFTSAVMIWTRQSLPLVKRTWYKKPAYCHTLSIFVRVTKDVCNKTILCRSMSVVDESWRRSWSFNCVFHISLQHLKWHRWMNTLPRHSKTWHRSVLV